MEHERIYNQKASKLWIPTVAERTGLHVNNVGLLMGRQIAALLDVRQSLKEKKITALRKTQTLTRVTQQLAVALSECPGVRCNPKVLEQVTHDRLASAFSLMADDHTSDFQVARAIDQYKDASTWLQKAICPRGHWTNGSWSRIDSLLISLLVRPVSLHHHKTAHHLIDHAQSLGEGLQFYK